VHIINPRRKLIQKAEFVMEKDKNKNLSVEDIYTPLSVAKKEIWKRWDDKELRKKVGEFLGGDIPKFLKDSPKAYFPRHVVSPNFDFLRFLKKVNCAEIDFVCPEYRKDKFVSKNKSKYHLCKMFFHDGKGKNGGHKISTLRIVDFQKSEGKRFEEIKTIWGENFLDFHHRILGSLVPDIENKVFDISSWFKKNGEKPEKFYSKFLALFIRNGILFENFLLNKDESEFTEKIVLKSFQELQNKLGVKPLIVHLLPHGNEDDKCWLCYPSFVKDIIKNSNVITKN